MFVFLCLSIYLCVSIFVCLSLFVFLCFSISVCLSRFVYLSLFVYLCLSISVCLSLSVKISLCLAVDLYVLVFLYLFICLFLCTWLSVSLSVCVYHRQSLCFFVRLSVYVSVFDSIYYVDLVIFSECFKKNFILIAGPILESTDENRSGSYDPPVSDPVSSGLTNPVLSGLSFSDPKDLSITDEEKELMRLAAQAKVDGAKGIFIFYFLFFYLSITFFVFGMPVVWEMERAEEETTLRCMHASTHFIESAFIIK